MPNTTPRNDKNTTDVTDYVQDMLNEMESEFTEVGNTILGRLDEMGKRMDDLDRSITDLMTDAGLDGASAANKVNVSSTSSQTTIPTSPSEKHQPAIL